MVKLIGEGPSIPHSFDIFQELNSQHITHFIFFVCVINDKPSLNCHSLLKRENSQQSIISHHVQCVPHPVTEHHPAEVQCPHFDAGTQSDSQGLSLGGPDFQ